VWQPELRVALRILPHRYMHTRRFPAAIRPALNLNQVTSLAKKDSLTIEQLQAARAERWRQAGNPVLTLEDATQWIESTGICLFLPRRAQLSAPAPSFVEAFVGLSSSTLGLTEIREAFSLSIRLVSSGAAVPLNLLGTISEQPDFFVSPEVLPYIFSLRGDRNWKRGPGNKSSQLAADIWKLLKRENALTILELQDKLGRGVTEGAVHRALTELWTTLYVAPVYVEHAPASWTLFESRYQSAMQTGGGMGQSIAISAMVSLYLDSVIAATSEEIETYLSPLAPRSRIREVARGLLAMRQLSTMPVGPQSLLFITGGLPEFPAVEVPAKTPAPAPAAEERPQQPRQPRKPFAPRPPRRPPDERYPQRGRREEGRPRRSHTGGERKTHQESERREWKPRRQEDQGGFKTPRRERREWKSRPGQGGESRPFGREKRPFSGEKRQSEQGRPERRDFSREQGSTDGRKPGRPYKSQGRYKSGPKTKQTGPKPGRKFTPKRPGRKDEPGE
jgi:23S rRNA pseudouridine2605 synthase